MAAVLQLIAEVTRLHKLLTTHTNIYLYSTPCIIKKEPAHNPS